MTTIATNWKKLSGQDSWKGLTADPLDPDFRRYLIHYGERCQSVYDAFNSQRLSKAYGYSLYPKEEFFSKVSLEKGKPFKYDVTKFFYASSEFTLGDWIVAGGSTWMGYVAVSTDEGTAALGRRDIMICWRGTLTAMEWFQDVNFPAVSVSQVYGTKYSPRAHQGFFSCYAHKNPESTYNKSSAREQVLSEVRRLVDKYRDEETSITVVGHSLGSSLATLNAADIAVNNYNKPTGSTTGCLVTAFVFASPLVGDFGFYTMFNSLPDLRLLRIRNLPDPVPTLPPKLLGFFEVGEELVIYFISPYLKPVVLNPHSLELYMHGIAGFNGRAPFELVVDRDIALANKVDVHLKEEYRVPPLWLNLENKAMYQLDDGSWELREYVPPPPEDDGSFVAIVHGDAPPVIDVVGAGRGVVNNVIGVTGSLPLTPW